MADPVEATPVAERQAPQQIANVSFVVSSLHRSAVEEIGERLNDLIADGFVLGRVGVA